MAGGLLARQVSATGGGSLVTTAPLQWLVNDGADTLTLRVGLSTYQLTNSSPLILF